MDLMYIIILEIRSKISERDRERKTARYRLNTCIYSSHANRARVRGLYYTQQMASQLVLITNNQLSNETL